MLPNCPLSLANPNTEKVKTMTFILAEAEKPDLVFCCHRSFALIFTCFFVYLFFLGTQALCLVYFLGICPHDMCSPMLSGKLGKPNFFPFKSFPVYS